MKLLTNTIKSSRQAAFTVVEILIVISVLVILVGVVAAGYKGVTERSVRALLMNDLEKSAELLEIDYSKSNAYPASASVVDDGKGLIKSDTVSLTYRPASDFQTYCLEAESSRASSIKYTVTQDEQPKVGSCPQAPVTPPTTPVVHVAAPTGLTASISAVGGYDAYDDYSVVTITWVGVSPSLVAKYEVSGCSVSTVNNPSAGTRSCSSGQIRYPAQTYGPLYTTLKVRAVAPDNVNKSDWTSVTIQYN